MLSNKFRKRQTIAFAERFRGDGEIVKQRSGVSVSGINLIPNGGIGPFFEVARDQRGFSGTGRTGNPDQRPTAVFIQHREQPLARHHSEQAWTADFREGRSLPHPGVLSRLSGARVDRACTGTTARQYAHPPLGTQATARWSHGPYFSL